MFLLLQYDLSQFTYLLENVIHKAEIQVICVAGGRVTFCRPVSARLWEKTGINRLHTTY
jgi:hypothetical protein